MDLIFRILSPSYISLNGRPLRLICSDFLLLTTANWEDLGFQGCTEPKEIKDLIKEENYQDLRKEGIVVGRVSFYAASKGMLPLFSGQCEVHANMWLRCLGLSVGGSLGSVKVKGVGRTRWVERRHVLVINGHRLAQSPLLYDFRGPTGSLLGWHHHFSHSKGSCPWIWSPALQAASPCPDLFFLPTFLSSSHSCHCSPYSAGEKRSEQDHGMNKIQSSTSSSTGCTTVWLQQHFCTIALRKLASFLILASSFFRISAPAVPLHGTCFLHISARLVGSLTSSGLGSDVIFSVRAPVSVRIG